MTNYHNTFFNENGEEEPERDASVKLAEAIKVADEKRALAEQERLDDLTKQELAELAFLPRGVEGLQARSNVQVKYHRLRYGEPKPNGSLEWLKSQREAAAYKIPNEIDSQEDLMAEYNKTVIRFRGNARKVSEIQAAFRRKGLNI